MNPAAFPEYMPYGCDQSRMPDSRPPDIPAAPAAGRRTGLVVGTRTCVVQRAIVWIKDWVQSKVAAFHISRALAPFVKSVSQAPASAPTAAQFEALASTLELLISKKNHAQDVIRAAVSRSMAKMDRMEQAAFRAKLGEFKPVDQVRTFSEPVWESLYLAVNETLARSICRDAESCVMNALKQIADLATSGSAFRFNELEFAGAFLAEHLKIITFDKESANASLSSARQMACIPGSTHSAVRQWFTTKKVTDRNKILSTLGMVVNDKSLPGLRDPDKKMRLAAFCKQMKEVLAEGVTDRPIALPRQR